MYTHTLHPDCSFPSTPHSSSPIPPLSSRPTPPFPFKKQAVLAGLSTKHSLSSYSKTKHKPSSKSRMRQPSRRKGVPSTYKRVSEIPPTLPQNLFSFPFPGRSTCHP